jgi:hypothetical protein
MEEWNQRENEMNQEGEDDGDLDDLAAEEVEEEGDDDDDGAGEDEDEEEIEARRMAAKSRRGGVTFEAPLAPGKR